MLNTFLFYKIYEKLFMNNFLNIIINNYKNGNIKFSNDKLIVFDIGAYKGTFSKDLNEKFRYKKKGIHFYLFDPLKKFINFEKRQFNDINYFDLAFDSSKPSTKNFYLNNFLHASGSSLKGNSFKDKKYIVSRTLIASLINPFKKMVKIIKVKTNNIDNFCKKNKIKYINILKIDTEGTELDVLLGSKKMIRNTDVICIEIQCSKNRFNSRLKKIEKLLNKKFQLFYKKRILIASILTGIVSYDYIYVRKKSLKT